MRHHVNRYFAPAGAVTAQLVQAITSLSLALVASRSLGDKGLGTFALLYGCLVLAAAVGTGLLGDSLTVLDRSTPKIRGGITVIGAATVATTCVTAFVATLATSMLTALVAATFAAAVAAFMLEDWMRRLLMARLLF